MNIINFIKCFFCGQQLPAIDSNVSSIFFLIIAGYSWQLLTKTKKGSGSKSKSDWVSFSDAKVLHFNMADAHVCSCLLIWGGEIKGLLSGDN